MAGFVELEWQQMATVSGARNEQNQNGTWVALSIKGPLRVSLWDLTRGPNLENYPYVVYVNRVSRFSSRHLPTDASADNEW